MMNMMDGWGGQMGGWMGGGMLLLTVLFWVLVVAGAVLIVRWLLERRAEDGPLEILKKRYARGEIDRETFERMRRDLEGGAS